MSKKKKSKPRKKFATKAEVDAAIRELNRLCVRLELEKEELRRRP